MSLLPTDIWNPIILSLEIASISLIIVFIFGILFGRLLSLKTFKGKVFLETFLMLPIVLPPTVIGFLLICFFGRNSPVGILIDFVFHQSIMFTFWAAVLASTIVAFPLMYQTVKVGFHSVEKEIEEAARVDGADERKVFLFITLPLSFQSILTGLILSFARALGEFGATFMFAGNIPGKTQTAPIAIYVAMESGKMTLAWVFVISMILISFLMLFITNIFAKTKAMKG